jgi:hypothetical protein
MTINLLVSKGKKTWIGKIKNHDFKLDFINDSSWAKDKKGVLEFTVKEEGYYMSQDSTGREYWNVFIDENGELNKKSVKKSDVISYLSNSEELEKKLKSRLFEFNMIKYAEKDTAWDIMYKPIKNEVTFFAENENYYMVSGKFEKISKQYIRNFTSVLNSYISEEKINNMIISKKRDNVEIKFLDEDRKDITMPVTIDNNSKIVAVPLNFVGVINSVESRV